VLRSQIVGSQRRGYPNQHWQLAIARELFFFRPMVLLGFYPTFKTRVNAADTGLGSSG
jgi:hypothetical protein